MDPGREAGRRSNNFSVAGYGNENENENPFLHTPIRASPGGMTKHSSIAFAVSEEASSNSVPAIRHDGWTPDRQAAFLRELAATHSVAKAARSVGMSRQSAYGLRARLKGEPFDRAWQAALLCRFDVLAEAALDRALNGVEVPHFYNGELVGTSRRYDERLTLALLAMRASHKTPSANYDARNPADRYGAEDFGALLDRVANGPETWDEEREREDAALLEAAADGAD